MNPNEHKSRNGERKQSSAMFHMVRAISRRSIRITEDNHTREVVDELLFQLDPESDLWAQIRSNRDQREEIMTGQQIDLDLWEKFMRGQGFVAASDLSEYGVKQANPQGKGPQASTERGQSSPPPRGGSSRKPTPGQISLINQIRSDNQNAEAEWIQICGKLQIDRPEQLSFDNASKTIDRLKEAAGWPAKPQSGGGQASL